MRWWEWKELALASYFGFAPVVLDILLQGKDEIAIDEPCSDYGTALQTAAAGGQESTVHVLLDTGGADVNATAARSEYGTALRIASARGHARVVRLLLSWGADPNATSGFYGTALEAAEAGGHREIVKILKDALGIRVARLPPPGGAIQREAPMDRNPIRPHAGDKVNDTDISLGVTPSLRLDVGSSKLEPAQRKRYSALRILVNKDHGAGPLPSRSVSLGGVKALMPPGGTGNVPSLENADDDKLGLDYPHWWFRNDI